MKFSIKKYSPYIVLFSLFAGITAPTLWTDGMFMDGTIYADISRNLAEGNGSFWHLHFSKILMSDFFGHPPLAFYLSSISFKIFGDNIYAERIYSFFTGLAAVGLMVLILKTEFKKIKNLSVSVLLIWLMFPLINWTYSNNMLENTVTVFVLLSSFFLFLYFKKRSHLFILLAGISLFAAFLSKGFTALFIWSVPFFYFIIYRKINLRQFIYDSFFLILYTILPFIIIFYSSKDANFFFTQYFNKQILGSLNHAQTVDNRFYIIKSMLNEMIIPSVLIILLIIILRIKKRKINFENENLKNALFFFLIALSGILPMMISLKQSSFYIVPALPFAAISLGFIFHNLLFHFPKLINFFKNNKLMKILTFVFAVAGLLMIFIFAGKPGRDKDMISDIYKLKKEIPPGEIITLDKKLYSDWSLYAYLQRYGKYNTEVNNMNTYFLSGDDFSDSTYRNIPLDLKKYKLYKSKYSD